ncbi:hypothetical protein FHG87_006888 [Trinorchestia longiramus]|nr:hypothetical protein FHG87_006888 [Trinorchestia longiramus]
MVAWLVVHNGCMARGTQSLHGSWYTMVAWLVIGNNGTTQGDPVEKKNIFQTEQLNANQKKDVHFDPKVAGRFITVVGQQRICVQYFQVFSDPK